MRRLVAAAEAKVEKRCVRKLTAAKPLAVCGCACADHTAVGCCRWMSQEDEVARLKRDIERMVGDATRRSRKETEQRVAETLRAADHAVITARGLCELRRRAGPCLAG